MKLEEKEVKFLIDIVNSYTEDLVYNCDCDIEKDLIFLQKLNFKLVKEFKKWRKN